MEPSINTARPSRQSWVYASLTVWDGDRKLKPSSVDFSQLRFTTPPHLASAQIQIIIANGDREQRHTANVLPHDPDATLIPIQVISA